MHTALREPATKRDGPVLQLTLRAKTDIQALEAEARKLVRENWADENKVLPKRLRAARQNMLRLAFALDQFDAEHGELPPPAVCDKNGKLLLSWRVAILPQLGEKALFDQFKLDEPWDSPHNSKLVERMPAVFAAPEQAL